MFNHNKKISLTIKRKKDKLLNVSFFMEVKTLPKQWSWQTMLGISTCEIYFGCLDNCKFNVMVISLPKKGDFT